MTKLLAAIPLFALVVAAAPTPRPVPLPQDLRTVFDDPSSLAATCADFIGLHRWPASATQQSTFRHAHFAWTRRLQTLMTPDEAEQLIASTVNVLSNGNSRAQIAIAANWCTAHAPR